MSYPEENNIRVLHKEIKNIKEDYSKLKIITMVLGSLVTLALLWVSYLLFFGDTPNTLSEKELKKNNYVLSLKDSIMNLNTLVIDLEDNTQKVMTNESYSDDSLSGHIIYAVQIGAFTQKNLSLYSDSFVNFREIRKGKFNKYALGNMESLEEAQELRRELVKLGFYDAFIASYHNGERLKIEEIN